VIVSSLRYHAERPDLILIAITSQVRTSPPFGEVPVRDWQAAGLLKPSVIKPVLATLEQRLVRKILGRLSEADRSALNGTLQLLLG
jgi:mRNA interferase MazF